MFLLEIPNTVPCMLVNRICGSGMISTIVGALDIMTGYRNVVLCGGFETMSRTPHYTYLRKPTAYGHAQLTDSLLYDGLTDSVTNELMGICTENVAKRIGATRADMDAVAIRSYQNAIKARDAGLLEKETCAVKLKVGELKADEELTKFDPEKMKKLKSAFIKDGTITAGNASKISDGAQGLLLMNEDYAKDRGIKPRARIVNFAEASMKTEDFTVAAIEACKKCLTGVKMNIKDMDYVELNEAFSIVPILGEKMLGADPAKINVHGGAVALGHPLG